MSEMPKPPTPPPAAPLKPAPLGYSSAPLGYSTPPVGIPGKRRNLQWYTMGSLLALVAAGIALLIFWLAVAPPEAEAGNRVVVLTVQPTAATLLIFWLSALISFVMALALGIYWLIWVFIIHKEMHDYTGGTYPVSPAQAVGFCFIPFFNLYWIVAMPSKLARELQVRLKTTRIQPGRVLACQVLSIFPGGLLFGLGSFCRAMAMNHLQGGLNELWRRASSAGSARQASDAAAKLAAMGFQ